MTIIERGKGPAHWKTRIKQVVVRRGAGVTANQIHAELVYRYREAGIIPPSRFGRPDPNPVTIEIAPGMEHLLDDLHNKYE
jgi:hypothetical protein